MLNSLILEDGRALAEVVAREHVMSISHSPADFAEFRPAPVLELMVVLWDIYLSLPSSLRFVL